MAHSVAAGASPAGRFLAVFAVSALLAAQPRMAAAVMKTYTGGSGLWTDGARWDPPGQPGLADDVTIASGSVDLGVDTTVATLTLSGGILTGSGTLTVSGLVTWSAGTMSGSGTTVAAAGMALGGTSKTLDQRTLVLSAGTAAMDANVSAIIMRNGAAFTNQGTVELSNDGGLTNNQGFFDDGSGGSVFNNQGTLRKSAIGNNGTSRFSGVALNNTGSVEVQAGTLVLGGGGTHSGATFTTIAPGVLDFGGGMHMLDAGCNVAGTGTTAFGGGTTAHLGSYGVGGTTRVGGGEVTFSGPVSALGAVEISSGTADFSGSAAQITVGSLAQSGGTLSGSNTLVVGGPASWTSGTMSGSGTTVLMAGLALGGTSKTLNQRTLVLSGGTASMNANVSFINMRNGATFTNQGVLELSNDGGLTNNQGFFDGGSGSGAFNNHGTLRKLDAGNSGTSRFSGVAMTNTGVVEVQAGALSFSGGFTQTAGTTRLSGGTLISATTLTINGGTLEGVGTIEGDVASSGHVGPGLSAGRLQIVGTYTQTVAGVFGVEIGGVENTQFDRLDVSGPATLAGTLAVSLIDGFVPTLGQSFQVMSFASRSGTIPIVTGADLGGGLALEPVFGAANLILQVVPASGSPTSTSTSTPTITGGAATTSATATATATASAAPSPTATPTLGASMTPTPSQAPTPTGTPVATPIACIGDCDGSGTVQIQELILAVNIVLDSRSVESCPAVDASLDGAVTVNELITAVISTLEGCP